MRYKTINQLLVIAFTVVSIIVFILLYINTSSTRVIKEEKPTSSMDNWTIETSVLNGLKLVENKNIYGLDNPSDLTSIYITIFPTKTDKGTLDFSAFDLHRALDQSYNPVLDANVIIAGKDGSLPLTSNTNKVNAIIRVRGNSSRGAAFKSYKINFTSEEDNFNGQRVLNLNKHIKDYVKISNKFCFDIMSSLENMVSHRTNFTKVYIKNASLPQTERKFVYYGLYTNIEQPNKTFLTSHGLDANGTVYKASSFEFREYEALKNIDDPEYNEEEFEKILGIREAKDHSKLIKMLKDINDFSLNFNDSFSKYFNEDNYLTWMATSILLGNEDIVSHNFMLYNPSNSMTWYLLPWDYDATFTFQSGVPLELKGLQRLTGVNLHKRYFIIPGNINKLTSKMEELLKTSMSEDKVNSLIAQYKPVLEQTLTIAPDVGLIKVPPNEINSYLNRFYDEIETNYKDYLNSLKYPNPVFTAAPEKIKENEYSFAWDPSFDFQGDLLTYSIKLSTDYNMSNIVFQASNLKETSYIYKGTLKGRYYLQVSIIDNKGNIQYSLDTYQSPDTGHFCFGVREVLID